MKQDQSNNKQSRLKILQKTGLVLLVITIIAYYVFSIQFLNS